MILDEIVEAKRKRLPEHKKKIDESSMRRLAEENLGVFAILSGNRYLIIRTKFEEFLQETSTI